MQMNLIFCPRTKGADLDSIVEYFIALFLTRGGQVFIVPQYVIPSDNPNGEWACPDFVALDFSKREVIVVEVTTSSNYNNIVQLAKQRHARWYERLNKKLLSDDVIDKTWGIRLLVFVREAHITLLNNIFRDDTDVTFHSVEDSTFEYKYWDDRKKYGIPNKLNEPSF